MKHKLLYLYYPSSSPPKNTKSVRKGKQTTTGSTGLEKLEKAEIEAYWKGRQQKTHLRKVIANLKQESYAIFSKVGKRTVKKQELLKPKLKFKRRKMENIHPPKKNQKKSWFLKIEGKKINTSIQEAQHPTKSFSQAGEKFKGKKL